MNPTGIIHRTSFVKFSRFISSTSRLNKILKINSEEEFVKKVMQSKTPVVVNFHAGWCDPCVIFTPKLIEAFKDHDKVDLAVLDIDEHPEISHTFEVKAVPAVLAVKNGLILDKFIGLVSDEKIKIFAKNLEKLSDKNLSLLEELTE